MSSFVCGQANLPYTRKDPVAPQRPCASLHPSSPAYHGPKQTTLSLRTESYWTQTNLIVSLIILKRLN